MRRLPRRKSSKTIMTLPPSLAYGKARGVMLAIGRLEVAASYPKLAGEKACV